MYAYEIDEQGFVICNYLIGGIKEVPEGCVLEQIPQSVFYRPKWDNEKWVEGETQQEREEREANAMLESLKPSKEELADADFEIKVLTLLMEMEVI